MNSIAILPRTMMNVLQNMNIKRDTLEKRAHIPDHFKPKRVSPVTAGTVPGRENNDSSSQSIQEINSQQYDNQYLPTSLHSKHNPFAVPDIIPEGDKQIITSVLGSEPDAAVGPAPASIPASAVEGGGGGGGGEVAVL